MKEGRFMKRLLTACLLLTATLAFAKNPVAESSIKIKDQDDKGVPTFVVGDFGRIDRSDKAAKDLLKAQKELLHMSGMEDFDSAGSATDGLGHTHYRFKQKIRGLRVVGADYIVHADASGNVYAMNGRFAPDFNLPRHATVDGWSALETAAAQAGVRNGSWVQKKAELVYVVNERSNAFLAWTATVQYKDEEGFQSDDLYADATSGDLVLKAPQVHRARNRNTYNLNGGTSLPGTLVMTETSTTHSDVSIAKAHEFAGVTYDYYSAIHARDSYNGAGATIKSSVHYSTSYNNAFWWSQQMTYGDGDGVQFGPFSRALDVVAHELTHAVTEYSANLVYSNESGALNEASSDILGAAAEAWKYGVVDSRTWKIGEDCYTPGTANDALRYMNNPTADGSSKDYYPERYTGTGDNGGVHLNSGIANLAAYLMAAGGTHPRGKTTINVTPLSTTATTSLNMAAKIWYRALTVYMTSTTNFAGARTASIQAATDLYGAAAAAIVGDAWAAVGVGTSGGGGGTTTLTNGVAVTNQSASTGTWKHFKIAVPAGQSQLKVEQTLGSGDADLYVRFGAQPTSSTYTCRPYLGGNTETCTQTNPAAGDWYVSIYAYATYSGVSIKATYTGTTTPTCTTVTGSISSGANVYTPSTSGYASSISGAHTGKLTGTATDLDLYLQKWNGSSWAQVASGTGSTSTENVTYNGTSGTYRWRIHAYSGSGTYSLCTTKP
jgi:Zn-dependent metalloprotease